MELTRKTFTSTNIYPEKVLQFGEGNFLRAFVDWIIYRMNQRAGFNGSVVIVQPIEQGMVDQLNHQDGLYTLCLSGIKDGKPVSEATIIDVIHRGINPYTQFDEYDTAVKNEDLRFIISNTTEAGIAFDARDQLTDQPQNSFPGKLTALLYNRYTTFKGDKTKGLIIIPCELIDNNGGKLKELVLKYAHLWSLEQKFIDWVEEDNIFCNSLVDRIVPGYPKEKIADISKETGFEDELVVEGEQFHLWVIEAPERVQDEFPVDKAGLNVLFVADLTPYRTRKVRILNGAHTSMVPVSYLYGINTVKESVDNPVIGKFIQDAIFEEIIPTLDLPRKELEEFAHDVLDRFRNPFIKHNLMSISLNSHAKYETRVLPSVMEYYKRTGKLPVKLVFSLAALIYFYKGERKEQRIQLQDSREILDMYAQLWGNYDGSIQGLVAIVREVLRQKQIWKLDLNTLEGLTERVCFYVSQIEALGMEKALREVMA